MRFHTTFWYSFTLYQKEHSIHEAKIKNKKEESETGEGFLYKE
jgi:hypothetical protein